MTDIHQHILWGLDDGPRRPEDMHAMLHAAHKQGVRRVMATPHANPGFHPFDMSAYRKRLAEAQAYCREHHLDMEILPGAEIAWTYHTLQALRTGQVPTLADTDCVLIELWENITWGDVRSAATKLLRAGYTPVFAHVERYRCFRWQPGRALALKRELGIGYQINASAVLEKGSLLHRRFMQRMLDEEGFDAVASDAHDCRRRPVRLAEAYGALKTVCGAEYARRLVQFSGVHE